MIGSVCLYAYNRKEMRILWNGKFYDPEFNNRNEEVEMDSIGGAKTNPK